jgi:hypothetical protein
MRISLRGAGWEGCSNADQCRAEILLRLTWLQMSSRRPFRLEANTTALHGHDQLVVSFPVFFVRASMCATILGELWFNMPFVNKECQVCFNPSNGLCSYECISEVQIEYFGLCTFVFRMCLPIVVLVGAIGRPYLLSA